MESEHDEAVRYLIFSKVKQVAPFINGVTIGPNALIKDETAHQTKIPTPEPKRIKPAAKEITSPTEERGLPKRQLLKLLDLERQEQAENALKERLNVFEQFNKAQKEQTKQSWLKTQQSFIEDMDRQELQILENNKKYETKQAVQQAKLNQMRENEMQRFRERRDMLRERERQRKILENNIIKIQMNHKKFGLEIQEILSLFKNCQDKAEVTNQVDLSSLKILSAEMELIFKKCKENVTSITEQDVLKSDSVIQQMIELKNEYELVINKIKEKKLQDVAKAEEKAFIQKQQQNYAAAAVTQTPAVTVTTQPNQPQLHIDSTTSTRPVHPTETPVADSVDKLSKCVSVIDFHTYTGFMSFLEQYRNSFAQLEGDTSLKTFKFDCKKAVNIPVNSLSDINPEHIMDKYRKLSGLLSGQTVTVSEKNLSATSHPQGIPFCMDLLAKKFVLQGDLMVSSNPESAVCYASMILSLWNDFPDFGRLILAHFYKTCPFLVPYNIPKQVGESDEEYYKKLGYQYSEGEVEKQDKYLKRMTGVMRLFFTLMISKPKRSQSTSPFNLKNGWKWLASFLRLEPQIDITATALHVFLETVGFDMDAKYGKMFQKVLTGIVQVFLPKCKEVNCTGGAVTRLELLLSDYIKKRRFDTPNGYIEGVYW